MYQQKHQEFELFLQFAKKSKVKLVDQKWREVYQLVRTHGIDSDEFINYARSLADQRYPFRELIKKWVSQSSEQVFPLLANYLDNQLQLDELDQQLIWQAFRMRKFQQANQIFGESLILKGIKEQKHHHHTKFYKIYNLFTDNNPENVAQPTKHQSTIVTKPQNQSKDACKTARRFYRNPQKPASEIQKNRLSTSKLSAKQQQNQEGKSVKIMATPQRPSSSRAYKSKKLQQNNEEVGNKIIKTPQPQKSKYSNTNNDFFPDLAVRAGRVKPNPIFMTNNSPIVAAQQQKPKQQKAVSRLEKYITAGGNYDKQQSNQTNLNIIEMKKSIILEKAKKFKNVRVMEYQEKKPKMSMTDSIELSQNTQNPVQQQQQQQQATPCAYIMQKLKQRELYDFQQEIDEEAFIKSLQKSPQFYDRFIRQSLGKTGPYARFLTQLKQDQVFNRLLAKYENYPLHKIYHSITNKSATFSTLYVINSTISEWQPDIILQQTKRKFMDYISKTINQSEKNLQNIMANIAHFVIDVLIRRADLPARVADMNRIGESSSESMLGEITFYDFVTLFVKIVDKSTLPYLGSLLHKNKCPIPVITCTLENGVRKYETEMSMLQSIMHFRKTKLILNVGTAKTEKKGKTDLIASLFGIEYNQVSSPSCQFHKGCVSVYSNLGSMSNGESIAIADLHGNITDALKEESVRKLADNANLVILHVDSMEENNLQDIFHKVHIYSTASKSIVLIRDSEKSAKPKPEPKYKRIYLKHLSHLLQTERELVQVELRETIMELLKQSEKIVNFKNLVPLAYKNLLFDSEKFEKDILSIMQKQHKLRSLWKTCFPSLLQDRQNYLLETKLYKLQNEIKDDPQDTRHVEYTSSYKEYKQKSKSDKSSLNSPVTEIFLNNNDKIKIKNLNNRIAEWKVPHTEILQKKIAQLRTGLETKVGNPEQLRNQIKILERSLRQFDVSADTVMQEIISNFKNENEQKYKNSISAYYEQLSKKMNPINLIDGYTLLFGNKFLSDFFQQISKQIQKQKKVYVISVLGLQSSAKSTLMNYLFNCEFETSAGRCTKGVYFSIARSQKQVIVVIDTEGLMSVSARDRVFDIQIACFTFLISDITIINNKGEISAPIRQLLSISIHTLEQLDAKTFRKQKKTKLLFAIRDQSGPGVQKQKSMVSDIINSLEANDDLVNYQRFIDFTSEDIYPLESAFIQTPTKLKTSTEKPNYYFSEQILAMRSKILKHLEIKKPQFANLAQFYTQSQRIWEVIKEQNEQIYDFQSIDQVRTKKKLKEIQAKLVEAELQHIKATVSEQIQVMQGISTNAQLSTFKQTLLDNFATSYQRIESSLQGEMKNMKGVKSEWKKFIVEDSKRLWNAGIIKFKESIYQSYRNTFGRNKFGYMERAVESMAKTMNTTKCTLEYLKQQYHKHCKVLLSQDDDQFYYNDNELVIKSLLENEVWETVKIQSSEHRQNSWTRNQDRKFTFYFSLSFLKFNASNFITRVEKMKYVELLEEKLVILRKSVTALNKKYFPLAGISNELLIKEYLSLTNRVIEMLKKDLKLLTKGWKFHTLKLEESNFRFSAFWGLCSILPKIILKNRDSAKKQQQKAAFIEDKWKQVDNYYKARGDAKQTAAIIISQFSSSLLQEITAISKAQLVKSLDTLQIKLTPAQIMQELMRLTFKSTEENQETWMRCFKMIYDVELFLKEEVIEQQNEIVQLSDNIANQKQNMKKLIISRVDQLKEQVKYPQNHEELSKLLKINSIIYQNLDNPSDFKVLRTHVAQKFNDSQVKEKLLSSIVSEEGIFKLIEQQVREYIQKTIVPRIIGCVSICPRCAMKCKLPQKHKGGHQCHEDTHLQECFAGIASSHSGQRSQKMCFTYQSIHNQGDEKSSVMQEIQQQDPEWLNHFQHGPYQDRINEPACEKVWANIGDVLIQTKYKDRPIRNANVFTKYQLNPLRIQDVKQWVERSKKEKLIIMNYQ